MTRGKGIAVHSKNCTNVQNLMYEVERKIDVEAMIEKARKFRASLKFEVDPAEINKLKRQGRL